MPSTFRRLLGWCLALEERLADIVLLAGGLILLGGASLVWSLAEAQVVTDSQARTFWGLLLGLLIGWLVVLAVFHQRGWLKVTGPLLFYDLLRIARRQRYFLLRTLYALLLGVLLGWIYLLVMLENRGETMGRREAASFAEAFFYSFQGVQFVVMVLLTPAYTAGSIAEEKDRKTLEFVLATDLRNREIVLSKYFSRLANLSLLLLAGLPILSFLQFMGGVDPNLVLAGFAGTGLTMMSLASLSMVNSVLTRKPRDAIFLTYLGAAAYLILSGASWLLLIPYLKLASLPSTENWTSPITVEDCVYAFNIGNPVSVIGRLIYDLERGMPLSASLPSLLGNYLCFHAVATVGCLIWAVARLRVIALKQSYGETKKLPLRARIRRRPRLGAQPMLWKELFVEPGLRLNMFMRIVVVLLVLGSFVPVAFIVAQYIDQVRLPYRTSVGVIFGASEPWKQLGEAMNVWVRVLGSLVATLLLLAVGARAASSVSNERDRQTMDALLTSPLTSDSILFAKWLGNIASVRWAWLWLGLIYSLGLLSGGLHFMALVLLCGAWLVYAAVASGIGVWFSIISRTSLRATIWTLLTMVGAGLGHWLIWMCCIPLMIALREEPALLRWVRNFQLGFTPPIALGFGLPFSRYDLEEGTYRNIDTPLEMLGYALLGIFCWTGIAFFLWTVCSTRFRLVSGRVPFRRLQRPDASSRPAAPWPWGPPDNKPELAPKAGGALLVEEEGLDEDGKNDTSPKR
jgi:ABC-type transport system involved in multi-copper enzyme maturation permease subunit